MIYIIYGIETLFINDKINEFKNQNPKGFQFFDGLSKDFSIDYVIDCCLNESLFSKNNTIIVKDPPFLIKKIDEKNLKKLYSYIDDPVYETDLFFYTLDDLFDKKLKIYKKIASNANVIDCKRLDENSFSSYGHNLIRQYDIKISEDVLSYILSICKLNSSLLKRNIELLSIYPDKIDIQTIDKICTPSDEVNSFDLINALTRKDLSLSIYYARKLLKDSSSLISTIGLLASQLRFYYEIAYYLSINKNKNDIIRITKCSDGRYYNVVKILERFKANDILTLLSKLSILDIKCKTNNTISDIDLFELFIIDLIHSDVYASY